MVRLGLHMQSSKFSQKLNKISGISEEKKFGGAPPTPLGFLNYKYITIALTYSTT